MKFTVRPTPVGAALLIAALAAGTAGGFRQELGALLWGSTFLGLGAYSFLTVVMVSFRLRSYLAAPPSAPAPFDGESCFPGDPLISSWTLTPPVRLLPGVFIQGEVRAVRPGREMRALTLLTPGKPAVITFEHPLRGRYRTFRLLHCRDALGFFCASLSVPGEGKLTVYPPAAPAREGHELPSLGGEGPAEQRSYRRSDEFFDLRKYQAGDDPRRIHWKLFAHLEELFIRQGEEEPPPSGEYPVFIDLTRADWPETGRPGRFGAAAGRKNRGRPPKSLEQIYPSQDPAEGYLDHLLGRFALWGQEILRRGGTLTLYGAGEPGRFRAGQEEELLVFLGGLVFLPDGKAVLPEETRRFYFLVTPFAEGWVSRFNRLQGKGSGRTGYLVIPAPSLPEGPPGSSGLLQRLLFCREEGEVSSRRERELLLRLNQVQEEAARLSPRGGVHVL